LKENLQRSFISVRNKLRKDKEVELREIEEKNQKREVKDEGKQGGKSNEELVNFLEHKLENIE
jgi:uncharacterized protein YggU (UPF0235/DUF167 family)